VTASSTLFSEKPDDARPPQRHKLKTDPAVFCADLEGLKTFEIRYNDRDYRVGDELELLETVATGDEMRAGAPLVFTGRALLKRVTHFQGGYGLKPGWVCLSFEDVPARVESPSDDGKRVA
jgi:hypothetical protein